MDRLARAQQRLRRNASPVRALPSHELALDDGDAQTTLRQRARAVLARRAAAEHDHVIVVVHVGSSSTLLIPAPIRLGGAATRSHVLAGPVAHTLLLARAEVKASRRLWPLSTSLRLHRNRLQRRTGMSNQLLSVGARQTAGVIYETYLVE
jgi:hypothetical protein